MKNALRRSRERMMTPRAAIIRATQQEELNFLITNRIPRRLATRFVGWFSRIEQPIVRSASIATWRMFCDVELADARKQRFTSLHDCFVRELNDNARPFAADAEVVASPCDAIVGASGPIEDDRVYQVKGLDYRLIDLLGEQEHADLYRDGCFATLRLTAGMYHHFHAPHDLEVEAVRYMAGDLWNVNPPALKRIEQLYCRNERATIRCRMAGGEPLAVVAVAAILVGGIRLAFMGGKDLRQGGTRTLPCSASLAKGERMGWFEHGSTIILFAPAGFRLAAGIAEGTRVNAGEPLMVAATRLRNGEGAL